MVTKRAEEELLAQDTAEAAGEALEQAEAKRLAHLAEEVAAAEAAQQAKDERLVREAAEAVELEQNIAFEALASMVTKRSEEELLAQKALEADATAARSAEEARLARMVADVAKPTEQDVAEIAVPAKHTEEKHSAHEAPMQTAVYYQANFRDGDSVEKMARQLFAKDEALLAAEEPAQPNEVVASSTAEIVAKDEEDSDDESATDSSATSSPSSSPASSAANSPTNSAAVCLIEPSVLAVVAEEVEQPPSPAAKSAPDSDSEDESGDDSEEEASPKSKKTTSAASESSSEEESEDESEDEDAKQAAESDEESSDESGDESPKQSAKPSKMAMALRLLQSNPDAVEVEERPCPQPKPSKGMKSEMSETAIWRAGILGPSKSPKLDAALKQKAVELAFGSSAKLDLQASPEGTPATGSRPPFAPPFEVAKFPAGYPGCVEPTSDSGRGNKGIQQYHRAASEGRFPKQHVDPRMAVSRAQENLEKHPDSLLARARAPAPLPRFVSAPQGPSQLKYPPPARDAWEYEKVAFSRDVVQVVRLESKPYVRKGRKEMQNDNGSRSKLSGLGGIYGPLVQSQERQPMQRMPRVQSLPALAPSRSPQFLPQLSPSDVQALIHGGSPPLRLTAIR